MSGATPRHIVVMGVAGTGKSTVARALASELDLLLAEGDDFHSAANVARMRAGVPLDDADRYPWLRSLAAWTAARHAEGRATVLTCSALRRPYRDVLRSAVPCDPIQFVHLVGSIDVVLARMRSRQHFMPPSLLQSQIDTLEPLETDECGLVVDNDMDVADVVDTVLTWLRGDGRTR